MSAIRRSYEAGHSPKFMVVIDGTPESALAVRFAARRALRTGARFLMLAIAAPPESFEWLGVGEAMRAEAEEKARAQLEAAVLLGREASGLEPETVLRTGTASEEILKLIDEDEDISFLVLAAGTGTDGPGPLVTALSTRSGNALPVPLVIVPGTLSPAQIDALAG